MSISPVSQALDYDERMSQRDQVTSTAVIPVGGMTCASCVKRVEKVISQVDGVAVASVNLATEKASVAFDPARVGPDDIRAAIRRAGYEAIELPPGPVNAEATRRAALLRAQWRRFSVAAGFTVVLLVVAMGPMLGLRLAVFSAHPLAQALTELVLVAPVVAVGRGFYTRGLKALIERSPTMDSLVALGTGAALVYSLSNTVRLAAGAPEVGLYYETAAVIISLVLLGKSLEAKSKNQTGDAIKKLMNLAPATATVLRGGVEYEVPIADVIPGDLAVVKPGGVIPADGLVVDGTSAVDESMLTGESLPVPKSATDHVYAATMNTTGALHVSVSQVGDDTALAQIVHLVEQTQASKAPIAALADVVAGFFVPIVAGIAVLAGAAWLVATHDVSLALTVLISVLVIACPCALGLATPTAIVVGVGKGAELGILIKSGEALERAGALTTVVLDKTGTVTAGTPRVTSVVPLGEMPPDAVLALAGAVEAHSEHPLGQAIAAELDDAARRPVTGFQSTTGRGVSGQVDGQVVLVGSPSWLAGSGLVVDRQAVAELAATGATPVAVAVDGRPVGLIGVADPPKASSREAVRRLVALGQRVVMLTGDNPATARHIGDQVGIDEVLAGVLPADKAATITALQADGKVAMVGDGINDAPALAGADVGIAIGSGTDVAIDSADIVLMRSDLGDVATAIELSRRTVTNIRQNLVWAFGYNVVGIPLAAGLLHIFGGPLLNPMFAAAAMSLSSVSVLANALRLKRFRPSA